MACSSVKGKMNLEAVPDGINMLLRYNDSHQLNFVFDNTTRTLTVAQVKAYLAGHSAFESLKLQPEFLDLVIRCKRSFKEDSSCNEILLDDSSQLEHYKDFLTTGHLMDLKKRELSWQDYFTYLKRQLTNVQSEILWFCVLAVAAVAVGSCFGWFNF
jgi:hypothetical protein